MFIYEEKGAICVTFQDKKPVGAPEYVIIVDEANKDLIVNGKSVNAPVASEPVAKKGAKEEVAPVVEEPEVKETVVEPEQVDAE